MKVIDAFWEKRNLGVSCKEIIIEDDDKPENLLDIVGIINGTEYVVVKVSTGQYEFFQSLGELNFTYIESIVNLRIRPKDLLLSPLQQRLNDVVLYDEMKDEDLKILFNEIEKGLFTTDRIIQDKNFTKFQAAKRYINWINDEIQNGSITYKITYKEETIGFFTLKQIDEGIYYPFLAGLYEKFLMSGLGFTTLTKPIEETLKRNGNKISTYASTNNLAVIRTHTKLGFEINGIQNVFIKHTKIKL